MEKVGDKHGEGTNTQRRNTRKYSPKQATDYYFILFSDELLRNIIYSD